MSDAIFNLFTKTRIPAPLLHFTAGSESSSIGPEFPHYFVARVASDMLDDPFHPSGLTNPTQRTRVDELRRIDMDEIAESMDKDAINALKSELDFLMKLGLTFKIGRDYFVSHLAEVFYHDDGLFANPTSRTAAEAVAKVIVGVVLPGMYWRVHYQSRELPDTIADSQQSRQLMTSILRAVSANDRPE